MASSRSGSRSTSCSSTTTTRTTRTRPTGVPGGGDAGLLEPFVALTFLAAVTERIRLGTGICLVPQRNPVYTAKQVVDLDALSGGRVDFGVGAGWLREEFDALGVPFERRGDRMREHIEVMKALWSDDVSEYQGELYQLRSCRMYPKPVQQPHPPIHVGGESDAALRRVADFGQGWYSFNRAPDDLDAPLRRLDELVVERGRYAVTSCCRCVRTAAGWAGNDRRVPGTWCRPRDRPRLAFDRDTLLASLDQLVTDLLEPATPDGVGLLGQQVLGRLSDLPIAVLERGAEGFFDLGAVEGREGEHGAAAHGGFVPAGGEHGGKPGGVAEGADCGHCRLAGERVVVCASDGHERGDRAGAHGRRAELAERPRARLDHGDIVVAEKGEQGPDRRAEPGGEVGGAPAHRRVGIGERDPPRRRRPSPSGGAGERAERRRPHARVGVITGGAFEVGGCARREPRAHAERGRVRGSFDGCSPIGAIAGGHAPDHREPRPSAGVVHGRLCR